MAIADRGRSVGIRRDYGSGSIYQRTSDGRWVGTLEAGWTAAGKRRRIVVVSSTKAEATRKLRDRRNALERGQPAISTNTTVRTWSEEWLRIVERTLRPKTWATNRGAITRWIVPTIGTRKLHELGPRDLRAVADAQRAAGLAPSSVLRTHRVLVKMLRDASGEEHTVNPAIFAAKAPGRGVSDRTALSVEQVLAVLAQAATLPHGSRWAVQFAQGLRQGECLGLTWDEVDLERGLITVAWQLQSLPYVDRKDKRRGFRVPDGFEARRLEGAFHLVRPKSSAGWRVIPMVPWVREILTAWQTQAPPSRHGLVWPRPDGRPRDKGEDSQEFTALQDAAGVRHPSGRPYTTHEARHTTATLLLEAGVPDVVTIAILGHSSIMTSRAYQHTSSAAARAAMDKVAAALEAAR